MKLSYKILTILFFVVFILVSGCVKKVEEISPEKYCTNDDDCITSCGAKIGKGDCYNKNYVKIDEDMLRSPLDNTCCGCDYVEQNYCLCQNNQCITKRN